MINELSDGVEKSTVGTIVMFTSMACIVYLVFKEGTNEIVDDLLTMAMIVSASLLGVNSIADIFKRTDNRTISRDEKINTTITNEKNETITKTENIHETLEDNN